MCISHAAVRNVLDVRGSAVNAVSCLECCVQTWSPAVRKDRLKLDKVQGKAIRPCLLLATLSSGWKSLFCRLAKLRLKDCSIFIFQLKASIDAWILVAQGAIKLHIIQSLGIQNFINCQINVITVGVAWKKTGDFRLDLDQLLKRVSHVVTRDAWSWEAAVWCLYFPVCPRWCEVLLAAGRGDICQSSVLGCGLRSQVTLARWACDLGVPVAEPGVAAWGLWVALLEKQSCPHAKSQTAPVSANFLGNYWMQKYWAIKSRLETW